MTTPTRAHGGTDGAATGVADGASNGAVDLTAAPRAVLRESMRLLYRVLGEERLGSAQGNAWAAICADRERAQARAEADRLLEGVRRS